MKHLPGRRAVFWAGIKLAAIAAVPLALLRSAAAQEQQIEPNASAGTGAADLAALRAEIAALKAQVDRMDAERSTIRAPFTIYGANSQTIFNVSTDEAGRARLVLGDAGGARITIGFTESGSGITFKDNAGVTRAQIAATPKSSQIGLNDESSSCLLGTTTDGDETGVFTQRGGTTMFDLSAKTSGGELRIFDGAGTALAKISNEENVPFTLYDEKGAAFFTVAPANTTGMPRMTIGDPAGARLDAGVTTGGTGSYLSFFDQAGTELAAVTAHGEGATFTLNNAANAEVFSAGVVDGEPTLRVGEATGPRLQAGVNTGGSGSFLSLIDNSEAERVALTATGSDAPFTLFDGQSNPVFTVGPLNNTGPVQMTIGDVAAAHVQLGVFDGASGSFVSVLDKAGTERASIAAHNDESPISVSDASSAKVFSVGPVNGAGGPMRLMLGDEDKGHVFMGVAGGDGGSYIGLYDNAGKQRVSASTNDIEAIALYDPEDLPIFSVSIEQGGPTLKVGKPDGARFETGVVSTGEGAYLSCYDSGNTERASVTATEKSTQLLLSDANMTATLGSSLFSDNSGLLMSSGDVNYAGIRFNKAAGGRIDLSNRQGTAVVRIETEKQGGGGIINVLGPAGDKTVGALWGDAEGGSVALYEASGKVRAFMKASQKGDFTLYGDGGALAMTSGIGAPSLDISDAAGTVLVNAYVTKSGVGAVAVGPAGNGVASTLGNMGLAASALLGQN